MKAEFQSVRFDATPELLDFIQKKLDKLETFYDRIISAEVFLRLENGDTPDNKLIEIKLFIPGNDLFAKGKSKSFEAATDDAVEALRRQLKKRKEKAAAQY